MDIEKRLTEHYKRWNIEFDYETQFQNFKLRICEQVDELLKGSRNGRNVQIRKMYSKIERKALEFIRSHDPQYYRDRKNKSPIDESIYDIGYESYICDYIEKTKNSQELATGLQCLFWAIEKSGEDFSIMETVVQSIKKICSLTPSVGFNIHQVGKEIILYPVGEELLDENVINYVLSGLENYPKSGEYLIKALEIYQSGDIENYRNLLDNLRFSVEQLLKIILKNEKSLKNQESELLGWLKDQEVHQQVINLYQQLLFGQYREYMNDAVKHNEKFFINDVEFMIYLTGNFMRLLIKCNNQ